MSKTPLFAPEKGKLRDFAGGKLQESVDDGVNFALTDITKAQYEEFYLGYSNSVLWPLLHNRLDLAVLDNNHFKAYNDINEKFADIVAAKATDDDFIWVHDYHFFLLGQAMRQRHITAKMGFRYLEPFLRMMLSAALSALMMSLGYKPKMMCVILSVFSRKTLAEDL